MPVTENEYKNAQEKVKKFEERKQRLINVGKEIQAKIQQFQTFKWEVDNKKGQVIFAGVKDGSILIGVANCNPDDKFNVNLGKLIAVRRSLGERVRDLFDLSEPKRVEMVYTGGVIANSGSFARGRK